MKTWHLDPGLASAYAGDELDDPRAYSVEAHLMACAHCRGVVAGAFDRQRLDGIWAGLVAGVHAPRPTPLERILLLLGIREHVARLIAATPSLSRAWIAAVAAALTFAVSAAHLGPDEWGLLVFLGMAPLVPVAGVAAAYGSGSDPTHEFGIAAPLHGWRLLQVRTATVLAVSIVLAGVAALALPGLGWIAAAWLLPAIGTSSATVALSTAMAPRWAGGLVAWLWLSVVVVSVRALESPLALFDAPTQVAMALVTVAALAVTVLRRETLDTLH